jgi:hypothetical protein
MSPSSEKNPLATLAVNILNGDTLSKGLFHAHRRKRAAGDQRQPNRVRWNTLAQAEKRGETALALVISLETIGKRPSQDFGPRRF